MTASVVHLTSPTSSSRGKAVVSGLTSSVSFSGLFCVGGAGGGEISCVAAAVDDFKNPSSAVILGDSNFGPTTYQDTDGWDQTFPFPSVQ